MKCCTGLHTWSDYLANTSESIKCSEFVSDWCVRDDSTSRFRASWKDSLNSGPGIFMMVKIYIFYVNMRGSVSSL